MKIKAKVIPGYGVASGKNKDPRYPQGTVAVQIPFFEAKGLDFSSYFKGTLNVDISPYSFAIREAKIFFEGIDWSAHIPPENFYFFDVTLFYNGIPYEVLIYMPDPKTKTEHQQQKTTLELILPKIETLQYGAAIELEVNPKQMALSIS